ncbi:ribonuclease P protein subunit p14-like [Saccostrea echinata]|uniref:ribonuclease P protein subunit p14-like n=1 Tax=Saccostrea echinata TaxID=191078 RepID=UPI002A82984D|nr:ribonuclease P protein subunit p14-like [Saccostrea echinata]
MMNVNKMKYSSLKRCYFRVKLEFEHVGNIDIGQTMFNFIVHQAVKNLFGEIGESCVDVIKYDPLFSEAIIVTNERFRGQLHSALTLFGCYDNKRCAFRVLQISSSLINLASDSRQICVPMKSNI